MIGWMDRSPDPDPESARASMGGWGLGDGFGGGEVQKTDLDEEYDDIEGLDLEKTQVSFAYMGDLGLGDNAV